MLKPPTIPVSGIFADCSINSWGQGLVERPRSLGFKIERIKGRKVTSTEQSLTYGKAIAETLN
jgi:hypothetical protein